MNTRHARILSLALLATALAGAGEVTAQKPGTAPEERPAPTRDDVTKALDAMFARATLRLSGEVTPVKAETGGTQFGGAMVITAGAGAQADPFRGPVEVVRTKDRLLVASQQALPGIAVLDDGTARITQTTTGSEPVDTTSVARDLPDLLDQKRLLAEVAHAEWTFATDATGTVTAKAKLRPRLIDRGQRGTPAMLDFLSKRVERIEAKVTLSPERRVAALEFTVARFDPSRAMQRRVLKDGLPTEGGSTQVLNGAELELDDADKSEDDFEKSVYALTPSDEAPSARAKRLMTDLAEVAKKDGF